MFSGVSNFSQGVDTTFAVIIGISLFFLIGISAVIVYFIVKYNKKKNPVASEIEGSTKLEIIWTVIPLILVLFMFWLGWHSYIPSRRVPEGAMKIKVTAQMWSWRFEYANGIVEDTLYIPLNKDVTLNMNSVDVIHSLYIPAFRLKEDVVPGKDNYMWFKAMVPGTYDLFCAEYCGLRHSYMGTAVKVVDQKEFDAWYAAGPVKVDSTVAAKPGFEGKLLTEQKGCIACHSSDGTKIVGPSYKGIFGHKAIVETNGKEREIKVDEAYIKKSILEPEADIVKGFPKGSMPSYKGQLTDEQLDKIVEYIKTLSEETK
ncbi:MAG TPA: cytochrome c oxidase subunit II [Bacteroidales bacterium]|jgi:cytochrome c oxidase subunit 2|nr:cytochrome c oxidase subunit II [Bacteroidales bacterium]